MLLNIKYPVVGLLTSNLINSNGITKDLKNPSSLKRLLCRRPVRKK